MTPRESALAPKSLERADVPAVISYSETVDLTVDGLRVEADIGVNGCEIGCRQPLLVSVRVRIDPPAGDGVADTFDYARVPAYAAELAAQRTGLIETFARRLGEACLRFANVREVELKVSKPNALDGCLAGTQVLLKRETRN